MWLGWEIARDGTYPAGPAGATAIRITTAIRIRLLLRDRATLTCYRDRTTLTYSNLPCAELLSPINRVDERGQTWLGVMSAISAMRVMCIMSGRDETCLRVGRNMPWLKGGM